MSTVVCLLIEPGTGRLVYSRAGHPPPLVDRADGASRDAPLAAYLDDGLGPALGLTTSGPRPEAISTLAPGTTLLLYTDGLVERRGTSLDEGLQRLATAVTARRAEPLPALVDGVLGELLDGDGAPDDVAVVAVRLLPAPLRLGLRAEPAQLSQARRTVGQWAAGAGLDRDAVEDLQLAIGEAAANAVEHAYRDAGVPGRVVIEIDVDSTGAVTVTVTDTGTWRPAPADPGFRGRGLQIISAVARDIDLDSGPHGTTLRFHFASKPRATPLAQPRATAPGPTDRPATLVATDAAGRRCLELVGDLDLAGTASVRDALLGELAHDGPVTLDLTRLGFVTSIGAGLLLQFADAASDRGELDVLLPGTGPARRLLDLTGLTAVLAGETADRPR